MFQSSCHSHIRRSSQYNIPIPHVVDFCQFPNTIAISSAYHIGSVSLLKINSIFLKPLAHALLQAKGGSRSDLSRQLNEGLSLRDDLSSKLHVIFWWVAER